MPPLRRLLVRLTYELGRGRALDNTRRELHDLDRTYAAIDALARRVTPEEAPVRRVA
jgi:hypothetical protein